MNTRTAMTDAEAEAALETRARRRVGIKMGFYIHALVFVLVNLGLFALNSSLGGTRWSHFPLWGWGLGLAIHDGSAGKFYRTDKIAFGSRVLFEPELGIGAQVSRRVSVEASWVHMSHAQLEGRENPGIDNLGFRLNLKL